MNGVVVHDNENEKNVVISCIIVCSCIGGYPFSFYDSMDAYSTRQENDHYVYHNATMTVTIPNGCLASTNTRECSPDQEKA